MKSGSRALGIAESYRDDDGTSTLGGAVVAADRTVDDFVFGRCTVGGLDSTDAVADCWRRLDRPDVRYLLLAGVAPAWYNLLDPYALEGAIDRPVVVVSFERSPGLEVPLREAFDGEALDRRLERYRSLPERRRITVDGRELFVRSVGIDPDRVATVLDAYTHGRRPEPLAVAKRAAAAADAFRRD